jgi:hypothetical protein
MFHHLLVEFIPIAVAAISPIGVSIVVLLLSTRRGLAKAVVYLGSSVFAFFVWGLIFLTLSFRLTSVEDSAPDAASLLLQAFLGIIFLVLAIRSYLTEPDPDAPPPKWKSALDKMGLGTVVAISLLMGFTNLRFLILIMVGADSIILLQPSPAQAVFGLLLLILAVLWPQLIPLGVYLAAGETGEKALAAMDRWLVTNTRPVNTIIFGLVGVILLLGSLLDSLPA